MGIYLILLGVALVYGLGERGCFLKQLAHRLLRRTRAVHIKPGIDLIALIERPRQALAAIVIGLVKINKFSRVQPPVLLLKTAQGLQKIKTADDLKQPLHLRLIERVDRQRRLGHRPDNQNNSAQPRQAPAAPRLA